MSALQSNGHSLLILIQQVSSSDINFKGQFSDHLVVIPNNCKHWSTQNYNLLMFVSYKILHIFRSLEYLPDNSLLLVHGTADDNVHLKHSLLLSRALIEHGILFKQMVSYVIKISQNKIFFISDLS